MPSSPTARTVCASCKSFPRGTTLRISPVSAHARRQSSLPRRALAARHSPFQKESIATVPSTNPATSSPSSAAAAPARSIARRCSVSIFIRAAARSIPSPTIPLSSLALNPVPHRPQLLSTPGIPRWHEPALGSNLFSEVILMNRRKFLSSALKTVSCAPLFANSLHALPGAARPRTLSPQPPQLALTMDDPRLKLDTGLQWSDANSRILRALDSRSIKAALFVCGMRVDEYEGSKLLSAWDRAGHMICNHSYSHLNYGSATSYADFAVDF